MTTCKATFEQALRLIRYAAWCTAHSSPIHVACAALKGELLIDVSDDGKRAAHVCAECLELGQAGSVARSKP